jgi:hypothetical protein
LDFGETAALAVFLFAVRWSRSALRVIRHDPLFWSLSDDAVEKVFLHR